jgi:hypothetical protein
MIVAALALALTTAAGSQAAGDGDLGAMRRDLADLQRRLALAEGHRRPAAGDQDDTIPGKVSMKDAFRDQNDGLHRSAHDDRPMMGRIMGGDLLEAHEQDFHLVKEHVERMEQAEARRRVLQGAPSPPPPACFNRAETIVGRIPFPFFFGPRLCSTWGGTTGMSVDQTCDQRFCPDRSTATGRAAYLCGGMANLCNA